MSAQAPAADPAYVVRGRQTEAVQRMFKARLDRFHSALFTELRRSAPDLLPRLDPPPQAALTGYQLLPRIVPDGPSHTQSKPQLTSFYWGWSDTLYQNEIRRLEQLEADLAAVSAPVEGATSGSPPQTPASARLPAFDALIAGYKRAAGARGSIDADVGYNWFWQRQIADDRPRFDAATRLIDAAAAPARADAPLPAEMLSAGAPRTPPSFVRVESPSPHVHLVTVYVHTDIADDAFVERFKQAVEGHWTLTAGVNEYRVLLDITRLSPDLLYCGPAVAVPRPVPCAPPAKGDRIDLDEHLARFPPGRAVVTTGATALHVTATRAIVLTPFDVTPRVLAHELGHLLGFPDAYLRGYRDLGNEGFRVIEFVPDLSNIMAAPGFGSVLERHFQQLVAATAKAR